MRVDIIEDFEIFAQLKDNWHALYDADPEAQLFLSWEWMSRWLAQLQGPWFILAAREDSHADRYAALFPMRLRIKMNRSGRFFNEINMAGNYAADYTGLICDPAVQERAISAFAKHLRKMNWARIHFENLCVTEQRARQLLAYFPAKLFRTTEIEHIGKTDRINNCICPFATLPSDWDTYLQGLSANTRQKIRRFLKTVETDARYTITHADQSSIESDLESLLQLWKDRWGKRKGKRADSIIRSNREMLRRCFESGLLVMPVLRANGRPVTAMAVLRDVRKRSLLFYMAGRDETFDELPAGLVLHAHMIRDAIANGFTRYDFLRGNEPYKYSFNVKEHRIRCIQVSTRDGFNLGHRLDPRSVPSALQRATQLHQAGHTAEAQRGYQQILEADSTNAGALYRLGQLKTMERDHRAAWRLFRKLVTVRPTAPKAWLWLARSCRALDRQEEAASALREATRLQKQLTPPPIGSTARDHQDTASFKHIERFEPRPTESQKTLKNVVGPRALEPATRPL